jgi:methyltransferase family protein
VWAARAGGFRDDPHRPLDPVLERIASYVEPEDVVIDVGGGAGRFGLPLALRCAELVNVDPSAGMRAEFELAVTESGIRNARLVHSDWLHADRIEGDVALVAHVTYFVTDIRAFVQKLQDTIRRRVIIHTLTVPPPNAGSQLFQLIHNEPQALVPNHEYLLPVLREMGIEPDVITLDAGRGAGPAGRAFPDRESAIAAALTGPPLRQGDEDRIRGLLETHFDELFVERDGGFFRRLPEAPKAILMTWERGEKR